MTELPNPNPKKTPKTVANWLFGQTTHVVRSKIKLCMAGGLWCAVIKCHPNRLRGFSAVEVENGPSSLLWPVAYITACTSVQAVMPASIIIASLVTAAAAAALHRAH